MALTSKRQDESMASKNKLPQSEIDLLRMAAHSDEMMALKFTHFEKTVMLKLAQLEETVMLQLAHIAETMVPKETPNNFQKAKE